MKKWWLRYFISILMIPVLMLACIRLTKTPHAEDIQQLFLEHEEEFLELKSILRDISLHSDPECATIIITEGTAIGSFICTQGSLSYYGIGPLYSQEEYESLHSAVENIFSSLNLDSLIFDQWGIQIVTSLSSYGNCRLFYLPFIESIDEIDFRIKEEINLSRGWYAVVTDD